MYTYLTKKRIRSSNKKKSLNIISYKIHTKNIIYTPSINIYFFFKQFFILSLKSWNLLCYLFKNSNIYISKLLYWTDPFNDQYNWFDLLTISDNIIFLTFLYYNKNYSKKKIFFNNLDKKIIYNKYLIKMYKKNLFQFLINNDIYINNSLV